MSDQIGFLRANRRVRGNMEYRREWRLVTQSLYNVADSMVLPTDERGNQNAGVLGSKNLIFSHLICIPFLDIQTRPPTHTQ